LQGRRVRCRHCGHVWRHEPEKSRQVAGSLDAASADWLRVGSTILAATDHASTMGRMVGTTRTRAEIKPTEWIDKKLGRYEIKSVLGQGAMGYVYEAFDRELRRTVALKILPRRVQPEHEPVGLKLFLQEARAAARLSHPNVVTILEVGSENGVYYFAMERVHGVTLASLVTDHGPLPAGQACYVIAHAARALAAAHALGIVHRDVKPSNLMIDAAGHVKVTDFGLATLADVASPKELENAPVGTPGWISPEVARGEKGTASSDIYGLGLVLYFALIGERLLKSERHSGVIRQQQMLVNLRREDLPASWPPRLRDVLVQCLQIDPRDRYQSAVTLAADLLRAFVPDSEDATVVLTPAAPGRREVPRAVSWAVLVLLVLAGTALAVWYWVFGPL